MLTIRQFQIANKLIVLERSIRIKDLAAELEVSTRTIKYDLDSIKIFLKTNNIELKSQPNKGIWVECSEDAKNSILNTMRELQTHSLYFDQKARMEHILLLLLTSNDYMNASYLADYLNVSRNTILSDLDYVSKTLKNAGLNLVRKSGFGCKLEGVEMLVRSFYENFFHDYFSANEIYIITSRIKTKQLGQNPALSFPKPLDKFYLKVEHNLAHFYEVNKKFQKENLVLLTIRIIISLIRVTNGNFITISKSKNNLVFFHTIWFKIFADCDIQFSKSEQMHKEMLYVEGDFRPIIPKSELYCLTSSLVDKVSLKENFPYYKDNTLYSRLISHLSMSFHDPKSSIHLNPFLKTIKTEDSKLFETVKQTCHEIMENNFMIINEFFISHIVLHFLVSKKNIHETLKLKAVLVCSTGRGAAKIISQMLESKIDELEISEICSLDRVNEVSHKVKPDIIISIFPIKSEFPVVVVEPIPTEENFNYILKIVHQKLEDSNEKGVKPSSILDFKLNSFGSKEISQQIIMIGLKIYSKLEETKIKLLDEGLRTAYISHVMLLAHRFYFGQQYEQQGKCEGLALQVKNALESININLEHGEIFALLNYFSKEDVV